MKMLDKIKNNDSHKELYRRRMEIFRTHYQTKYGIKPDDEVLYIFIRINEMQMDMSKKIEGISELRFNNSWDYFMYALGSSLKWLWVLLTAFVLSAAIVYYTDHKIANHDFQHTQMVKKEDSVKSKTIAAKTRKADNSSSFKGK